MKRGPAAMERSHRSRRRPSCCAVPLKAAIIGRLTSSRCCRQDAARARFGSRSTWPLAIPEGDGDLADLARLWRGAGGVCVEGAELVNLKVAAVWGFHRGLWPPDQNHPADSSPWWETRRRQQEARGQSSRCPHSN